jgi:CRISPR system Cascade subunit CasD
VGSPVLLLRLEGPLQSWGGRSRWDVRDTQTEPTKSGIIGLLGCALGYPTGDRRLQDELDAGLRFGVRVEHPGRVLEDYQTVTDFLPTAEGSYKHTGTKTATSLESLRANPDVRPATIISPRFYLEDAAFLVGLEGTDVAPLDLLRRCADALQRPTWPLFLGRKACVPTRPIFDQLTSNYDGLESALRYHAWSWLGARNEARERPRLESLAAYIEDSAGPLVRQDALRINPARQYGFVTLNRFSVPLADMYRDAKTIEEAAL